MIRDRDLTPLLGRNAKGELVGFTRGKDTVDAETALPEGALREALNVDLDRAGRIRRRPGYTPRYPGSGIHSLWASRGGRVLFGEGGTLKELFPDWTSRDLRSGLDPTRTLTYEEAGGVVYWSNGAENGRVLQDGTARPWGVPSPPGQPTLSVAPAGALPAGRYQVSVTFVADDGEESGATIASVIDVPEGGGIDLANIPQGPAARIRVYASPPNGDVLYQHLELPMGFVSARVVKTIRGRALETQLLDRVPAAQIVRFHAGRFWLAVGDLLFYTPAFRWGLHSPAAFFQFAERIRVLEPVADGLYVVAERTWFLSGVVPEQMSQTARHPGAGVEGTGITVPGRYFGLDDAVGDVAYWFGDRGAMLGLPGGTVRPLMEDRVALSQYASGATLFRERQGIRQLVTALAGPGQGSGFGAADSAVAEVRKNVSGNRSGRDLLAATDNVVAEVLRDGGPI